MAKKISVTLSLEIIAENLVKYLIVRYLNILNFRFSIALKTHYLLTFLHRTQVNKSERLDFLEASIKEEIESSQNSTFTNLIPYIQLHEYEALIFSSLAGIEALFETSEVNMVELESIIKNFPNPEDINNNPNTAPSKRLLKNIEGYSKVVDGVLIIDEIGIETVIAKCPRFRNWLETIIGSVKN